MAGLTGHLNLPHRQEGFPDGDLLAGRNEVVIHQVDAVQAAGEEVFHQLFRQFGGGSIGGLVGEFLVIRGRGLSNLPHRIGHLAADAVHGDIGIAVGTDRFQRKAYRIGIERAAEGGIGGEGDEGDALFGSSFGQSPGVLPAYLCTGGHKVVQHALQLPFVGTHSFDGLLRLAELGGGHELHRGSDLQRALDGADAALDFL